MTEYILSEYKDALRNLDYFGWLYEKASDHEDREREYAQNSYFKQAGRKRELEKMMRYIGIDFSGVRAELDAEYIPFC